MEKELLGKFKNSLETEKTELQKQLERFATEDKTIKGNWQAKHKGAEDTDMEEKADEMEEYDNLLSLEHSLELRLKDVNVALEKITAGGYGACEKCGREIETERLEVCPEARLCMKCNENK
jgi:DnaK suppressor protein